MNVDQSRNDKTAAGVDGTIRVPQVRPDPRDAPIANEEISLPLKFLRRIKDRPILDEKRTHNLR
jgi:hypothetical protein